MDHLTSWLLYAALAGTIIYHLPHKAGGWRGLWHQRTRLPALMVPLAVFSILIGDWMSDAVNAGALTRGFADLGGVLVFIGVVGAPAFAGTVIMRMKVAQLDARRIAEELDTFLDPTDRHFVVDDASAHRPLELLNELSQLIGPGDYAPGQPWATHEWIAERMPAARAVKPVEAVPRIDAPAS